MHSVEHAAPATSNDARISAAAKRLAVTLVLFASIKGSAQSSVPFRFTAANYTVVENAGAAAVTVSRTSDLSRTVSVEFATADGLRLRA